MQYRWRDKKQTEELFVSLCFDLGSHQTGCIADFSSSLVQFPHCLFAAALPVSQKQHHWISVCVFFFVDVWIMPAHKRSIQFLMGPPGLHSSSLLIFSCSAFRTPRGWDVSIGPAGRRRVWAIKKQIEDERKREKREEKNEGESTEQNKEDEAGGARGRRDHRGPRRPLTLIVTSEIAPEVRGCVKVPLRRFTPLLGDDDLMQPPQPVWHDQCCTLLAAPRGHTSISNPATQGPLKAPYRQSQWTGGKGTQTEKSGKAKGQKGCF